jgi:hypothetical protein
MCGIGSYSTGAGGNTADIAIGARKLAAVEMWAFMRLVSAHAMIGSTCHSLRSVAGAESGYARRAA